MTQALRQQLIDTALAMNVSSVNQGASGNLSVRCENGMLITPSGMDYTKMSVDDIVWMDFDGSTQGRRKPSSEWQFHAAIYEQRVEAQAVVHAHPVNCAALACLGKGIPAFHYMVAVAGGKDIRCAPYATFGSRQLSDNMIAALREHAILFDRSSLQRLPPSSDVTPQLHLLLASKGFQREIKRFQELLNIRTSLRYWGSSFPALELMLAERRPNSLQFGSSK